VYFESIDCIDHPVWRGHREEAKRGPPCEHRIRRNEEAMLPLLLPCAPTGLASIAAWCGSGTTPSGSAVVTCLNATARTRRAERAMQSDVLSVWQVLHGTLSVPRISAQRVARFDDHCTSNLFINSKLRQRYSRCKARRGEFVKYLDHFDLLQSAIN
jgi:hypothetical protein